jgi:type 1 fimbria pilin
MKMKKSLIVLLVLVSALLIASTSIFASQPLTINLNGTVVSAPSDTRIVEGQVMVPLRWAAEQLGASSIEWEPEKRNVTIKTNQDAGTYQNVLVALPDVQLFLPLPNNWTIERTKHGFDLKDAQGNTLGSIDQQDGYYLPNHSETLSDQKITVSQGESHLLVLSRSYPAASGVAANWQEVHALLPFKEQIWIDLCVRVSPEHDVEHLKTILEKAITGVVYYQPERPLPPTETGRSQPAEITEWEPTIYTTVNNLDGVSMKVKEGTASSTSLTVGFENNSSSQCIYGEHYWLEKKINGSWYQVPVVIDGNYGFNDIGYNLAAGAKGEWAVDWNWLYGSLDTGEYRLVKDILDFRGPGEYDTYYLTGEFTI